MFTTLLNVLAATPDLNQRPVAAAMLKELSRPNAPGLCVSCHSVEKSAAGEFVDQLAGVRSHDEPRGFTKFSHGPHLLLPQLADCTHCHAIDDAASDGYFVHGLGPEAIRRAILWQSSKRQCVECHTARAAGDRVPVSVIIIMWNRKNNCGFRISDCGLRKPRFNPQSEIRNPQSAKTSSGIRRERR